MGYRYLLAFFKWVLDPLELLSENINTDASSSNINYGPSTSNQAVRNVNCAAYTDDTSRHESHRFEGKSIIWILIVGLFLQLNLCNKLLLWNYK